MTFNRSCSYAGIANLLEEYNFNYEDYEIIKALSIPYILEYDSKEKQYVAGAMIQFSHWFNYFLNSIGLCLTEDYFTPENAIKEFDKNIKKYMLGIILHENNNLKQKHAVIFENKENGKYKFLNPKRINSNETDYYIFTKEELIHKLPMNIKMGYLIKTNKIIPINVLNHLLKSLQNIDEYRNILIEYCSKEQDIKSLNIAKESLFATIFLDILAMMELIGENDLANKIKDIRTKYLNIMKENISLTLFDYISIDCLNNVFISYKNIIVNYISNIKEEM